MEWTSKEIDKIRIDKFLEAMGCEWVGCEKLFDIYNVPQVKVDGSHEVYANSFNNRWYGAAYGCPNSEHGTLRELVGRIIDSDNKEMQDRFIRNIVSGCDPRTLQVPCNDVEELNRYKQQVVEQLNKEVHEPPKPTVINLNIRKLPLTEFMAALGQEHPVAADGSLRIYNAPYAVKPEPTMVINTETNLWRDTKSGSYGGIYDLAYEMTGSCNMSELNRYISGEMSAFKKAEVKLEQEQQPKRGMRL